MPRSRSTARPPSDQRRDSPATKTRPEATTSNAGDAPAADNPAPATPVRESARAVTARLETALRARYPLPAWALNFQVARQTGHGNDRTADALAIGCYPSYNFEIIGFELKASRNDWLRELRQPDKADRFGRFCHRFIMVTPPDVILPAELPVNWGHLELHGKTFEERARAALNEPQPLPPELMASWLRNANGHSVRDVQDELRLAHQEGVFEGYDTAKVHLARDQALIDKARENIDRICEITGLNVRKLMYEDPAAGLLRLLNGQTLEQLELRVQQILNASAALASQTQQAMTEIGSLKRSASPSPGSGRRRPHE